MSIGYGTTPTRHGLLPRHRELFDVSVARVHQVRDEWARTESRLPLRSRSVDMRRVRLRTCREQCGGL